MQSHEDKRKKDIASNAKRWLQEIRQKQKQRREQVKITKKPLSWLHPLRRINGPIVAFTSLFVTWGIFWYILGQHGVTFKFIGGNG